MSSFQKTVLFALIGLGAVLAFAPRADAALDIQALKPDLRVVSVKPSTVGPKYVRVVIKNNGFAPSAPCYVRVKMNGPTLAISYWALASMPPNSTVGFDVYMSYSPLAKPGMVTEAMADIWGQVAETNETNNTGYFIAPPG